MQLCRLRITDSRVTDLGPLAQMPLTNLVLHRCKNLQDISALVGLPLQSLDLDAVAVKDLTPLKGMRLESLVLRFNTLTNLAPITGMPLRYLQANVVGVADLTPLAGLPVRRLLLYGGYTRPYDISPLRTCRQLEELVVSIAAKDWNVLLDIPTLKTVTRVYPRKPMPPAQFIAEQTGRGKR